MLWLTQQSDSIETIIFVQGWTILLKSLILIQDGYY